MAIGPKVEDWPNCKTSQTWTASEWWHITYHQFACLQGSACQKVTKFLSLPQKLALRNPVLITLCSGEVSHKCTWSKCYLNLSLGHKGLIFVVLVNQ